MYVIYVTLIHLTWPIWRTEEKKKTWHTNWCIHIEWIILGGMWGYYYVGLNLKLVILVTNLSANHCNCTNSESNKISPCEPCVYKSAFAAVEIPINVGRFLCVLFFCSFSVCHASFHWALAVQFFFRLMDTQKYAKYVNVRIPKFAQSSHWHTKHLI